MTTDITLDLPLPGISCGACAGRVTRALSALPGIADLSVNPVTKHARMRLDGATLPQVQAALDQAGYPADLPVTRLDIAGMSCGACSGRVARVLSAHPQVAEAQVNLATHRAQITHAPDLTPQALARIVTDLGYPATVADDRPAPPPVDEAPALRRAFLTAAALSLPVVVLEMGGHLVPAFHHWLHGLVPMRGLWLVQMALTLAVLAGPGRGFFAKGLTALRRGAPEMNSLVALGAGAAFLFSAVVTLAPDLVPAPSRHVWFEAAAVIVTLILMGRWFEARAKGRAGAAIRALVALAPDHATALRDGRPVRVAVADLRPGDTVLLAPGERIALDGVLTEGTGAIDESMLTGEPVPVVKSPGDRMTGGTVNGNAALTCRVTATGGDTVLARIVALVEQAQAARLPVQALVDRITRVFVPVVIGLAALTFALWLSFGPDLAHAVVAAVSVLIIACPCAMGLAVPVSIMVGSGRGAQLGVLFRRGDALQKLAGARVVAFDKTGTLTQGHPRVTGTWVAGIAPDQALRLTAAAEARSEHPLAAAILEAARDLDLPPAQSVTATPGRGLTATVEGHALLIGNASALTEAGIALDPTLATHADAAARQGATPVHLAVDGTHRGVFALADPERPEAAATIAALDAMGLGTVMLSGDLPATAQAVGARLGLGRIQGGLSPEAKLDAIRDLGPGSVFVGDGINDAPALAAAETGLAIGTGTDIAIESADAVLMSGDPQGVVRAIRLSRAVMRNIRQNLFWAFAYNVALIPVAMGVLVPFGGPQLSPMLGAGAMALSSVFVVTNALRLRTAAR
ncbi:MULTISPECIES: heavy metal translocating P-type ATPase [Paracoccus]|uniref:heavy metal translocating P-type ATPase n=1 Tax=Paracoccus TaxID=265 RepID=UPI00086A15E6|nr:MULTISPECIES: heavy metal translocating P-type ATPase [Paracoccus]ODT59987.1 MAG: copper-translocating P-type ATPase [Paracoccus sp. SCN 68-21]